MGKILNLTIGVEKGVHNTVNSFDVIKDKGIVGDRHFDASIKHVSLIDQSTINKIKELEKTAKGLCTSRLVCNIVSENIGVSKLKIGSKLRVNNCLLEVIELGKPCYKEEGCFLFDKFGECPLTKELVFLKVLSDGTINKDDEIILA